MKKIFLALTLLIGVAAIAQIKFEPGYFIDNNGKKTECLIRNLAWKNNPETFEYILSEGENPQKTTIQEVSEFSAGNGYKYKRFTTEIDYSSNNTSELSVNKSPDFQTKTVFLKTLIEGKAVLYQYEELNLIRYFISQGNAEKAEQLVYKIYLTEKNNTDILTNNYFRQQLFMALKSPELSESDFKNISYNKNDLTKLFIRYNEIENVAFTNLDSRQNKNIFNFKITAAAFMGKLNVMDHPGLYHYDSNKAAFGIGFETELVLPFNQHKWSLFLNPNYQVFNDEGETKNYIFETKYNLLQIPIGIRHYMFLNEKSKLFLNAGLALNIPLNSNFTYQANSGKVETKIEKSSGFFTGFGYGSDNYWIEARYAFKNGILSPKNPWKAQYSSIGIIFSYKLF